MVQFKSMQVYWNERVASGGYSPQFGVKKKNAGTSPAVGHFCMSIQNSRIWRIVKVWLDVRYGEKALVGYRLLGGGRMPAGRRRYGFTMGMLAFG